ncbi:MAG: TonB-dependent receptor [Verrucomicrobiota bacterium]
MNRRGTRPARCRRYVLQAFCLLLALSTYPAQANPAILVNHQGLAQQDLSIRGSSYTGTGISINGLNLKVPYSAHFNSELPIFGSLLSNPATQYGLGNASGHLVGTAAYTTVPQEQNGEAGATIGTREHYSANASAFASGVGGFLEGEKARRVDYNENDYDRYAGGAHIQHFANDWQIDLIGAGQKKDFGAQGYYGQDPATYAEQKTEDALVFLGATHGELDDAYFRTSAAWRQFDDEIIGLTPIARNVRSRFGAMAIEGRTIEIQHIALNLRGDVENEYADGRDRTRGSVLVLPEARFERVTLKVGLNSVFQSSEAAEWLPQAGIDWFATDNSQIYASYSETVRQPDFQSLESEPLLQMQKSQNSELGLRQFLSASLDWRAAVFHRRLENASDWIGATTAIDLGTLNVAGLETGISYYPSDRLKLNAFYQWVHKDNNRTDGFYELDYPEHLLNLSAYWNFLNEFALEFAQTTRYQTENDARTSSDFGADASLGLHYLPRFANNVRLSFRVENLWGSNFQAIPGLKPRPTAISTGITVTW